MLILEQALRGRAESGDLGRVDARRGSRIRDDRKNALAVRHARLLIG